ncbi:MAG: hypothetical protein ACTSWN_13170, partial [Promethearchaeota archaeon]
IEIHLNGTVIQGNIIGVQKFPSAAIKPDGGDGKNVYHEPYLVICQDNGEIKNVSMKSISGPNNYFLIQDKKMQEELKFFINTVYLGKKKNSKTLTIYFDGDSPSEEIMIIYLHKTPSWKCSYRLISGMYDDESEFHLQDYAIVDNILDEDWNNVELTLVAGLPISFIYDLYTPTWITRSEIKPKKNYGLSAVEFEEKEAELGILPEIEEKKAPPKKKKMGKKLSFARVSEKAKQPPVLGAELSMAGGATMAPSSPPPPPSAAPRSPPPSAPSRSASFDKRRIMADLSSQFARVRDPLMGSAMGPGRADLADASSEESGLDELRMEMAKEIKALMAEFSDSEDEIEAEELDEGEPGTFGGLSFSPGIVEDLSSKSVTEFKGEEARTSEDLTFKYVVPVPTTVKRNQSALIPILEKKIKGEKVSVYNEDVRKFNPMLSIYLKNNTGHALESGPITFYEFDPETADAIFEGEAILSFMKNGDERTVPYSVDLEVRVVKRIEDIRDDTHQFIYNDGDFYKLVYNVKKFIYKIINSAAKERKLIIEQPKVQGFYLHDTDDPIEKTMNYFRFKVKVPKREVLEFPVTFRRLDKLSTGLDAVSPSLVRRLQTLGKITSTDFTYRLDIAPDGLNLKCCTLEEKKIDNYQRAIISKNFESKINGKELYIFNYNYMKDFPLKCIEMINSLDKIIESGPVAIFKEGKYLSSSMIPILEKEESALLPYSIDMNCAIIFHKKTKTRDTGLVFNLGGLFRLKTKTYNFQYEINNDDDVKKLIIIEQWKIEYDLFESPPVHEERQDVYRFLNEVGPKQKKKVSIKFRGPSRGGFSFNKIVQESFKMYSSMKLISESEYSYKIYKHDGDRFSIECYRLEDPDIEKLKMDNRTDLVPGRNTKIVKDFQADLDAELYLIYINRNNAKTEHPVLTLEFNNTLDRSIPCGPVTIYENGAPLGESIIPIMNSGEKVEVPITRDKNVSLYQSITEKRFKEPHAIVFRRSGIYLKFYIIKEVKYSITNENDIERTIVIEYPRSPEYELLKDTEKAGATEKYWYITTEVEPNTKEKEFSFKLRKESEEKVEYKDITRIQAKFWIKKGLLDETQEEFVRGLCDLMEKKAKVLKDISRLQKEYDDIFEDQKRLRANLKSLQPDERESRKRYTKKLEDQEVQIEDLYQKIKNLNSQIEPLSKEIESYILNKAPISEDDVESEDDVKEIGFDTLFDKS